MPFKPNVWNTKRLKYSEDLQYEDFVSKREDGIIISADKPTSQGRGPVTSYDNILTRDTGSEVYLARLEFQPGGGHEYHAHSGVEIIYMLDGKLEVYYRSKDERDVGAVCRAGDTVYVPPGTPHAVWNTTKELCHFLVIKYGPPFHYEEIPLPPSIREIKFHKK